MAQKITKMAQECFDIISQDASVMNTFKKDNSSSKVWSHNKKTANFYENLLLKNKINEKYSKIEECHNNIYFSLKSLLEKNLKQNLIQKQIVIQKVNKVSKDVTQCINFLAHLKTLLEKEKPFSDEDRKSLLNTKEYVSKLNSNLSIVNESLKTIAIKWDDLIDKQCIAQVSLTKIMENAQEMSKQMVSYAYKAKNANQNAFYSFSLDQNYSQIKKNNQELLKNTKSIKTIKSPLQKHEVANYVDSTYLLVLFNSEMIIKVQNSLRDYNDKNTSYNLKATQQHINSLRKYITDFQTQLQSINKLYLGRQSTLKQKLSQKSPQTKPSTSPIQTPTKNPSSQSLNSPPMQKSQSQSYSPHQAPFPKQGMSGSQVSGDDQSRFQDIRSEKSNKSGVKQSKIQSQKGESHLAQLIRLVSQNDNTLAKLIPKSQHQPPAFATLNVNHRELLVLQQKNNKAVQIAIDLFEKHQHDLKQNVPNSSSAQKGNQKEQNAHGVDDTASYVQVVFSKQDVENARKQTEEKVRKELEDKHKQAVDVLNAQINKLTVQLSGKEETHNKVVAELKGEIDKINLQLDTKLLELQTQKNIQNSLSTELDKIKAQKIKLQQTITALQASNKQLSDKNNQIQQQHLEEQQKTVKNHNQRISQLTKQIEQLNNNNNFISQQNLQLKQQTLKNQKQSISELNKKIDNLQKQKSDLTEQNKNLNQSVQGLQKQLEEANKPVNQKSLLPQTQPQAPSTQLKEAPQGTEVISQDLTQVSQTLQITQTKMVQPINNQPKVQDEGSERFNTQPKQGKEDSEFQKKKQKKLLELSGKKNDNVQELHAVKAEELKTSNHKPKQEQATLKTIGQELQALQNQINQKLVQKNQLTADIQNLTKVKITVENMSHLIAEREKQRQSLEQELRCKRQQMQEAIKYVNLHNNDILEKQQKAQQLKRQLQKLQQTHRSTVQQQQQQKTTLNTQLSQLQSKLQTARNQLLSVQGQINVSKQLLGNINDQKQTEAIMRKQLETLTVQVNEKKQQLDGLNNETTQKQLDLSKLEKKLLQTKREEDKVNGQITVLKERVKAKKDQIETWQKLTVQAKKGNEQKLQQQSKLNDDLAILQNQIAAKNKDILELQLNASEYEKKLTEFRMSQATNTQKLKAIEAKISLKQQSLKETRMSIVNMISSINIDKLREDIQQIKKSCNSLKSSQRTATLDQEKQSLASFSKKLQTANQKLGFFLQNRQKGRRTFKNANQNSLKVETDDEWSQQELQKYVQLFEDKLKAELQLVVQELKVKMLETNQHEMNYQSLLKDTDNQNKRLKSYKQQINKLQQTKLQVSKQNNQLTETKKQIQNELNTLKKQYQSYIISQFGSVKQTSDYQTTIINKNNEIQKLTNIINQLNNTINQKDRKANQLSGRLSSLNNTIAQLKSAHEEALKKVTAELTKTTEQAFQKVSAQFKKNIQLQEKLKSQKETYQAKITQLQKELKQLRQSMAEDLRQSKIQIGQGEAGKFAQEVQQFGAKQVKQVQKLREQYEKRAADMQSQLQTFKQNLHDDFNTKRSQYQKQVTTKVNTIIAQFNKTNASISQQRRKYHDLYKQTVKKEQYLNFFLKKIYCAFIYYNKVDQNTLSQEEKQILDENTELKEQQARNVLKYALETISRVQQEKQVGNKSLIDARQKVKNYQEQYQELNNKIAELKAFIEKLTKSEQFQKSLEHLSEQGSSQKQKEKPIDRLRQSFIGFAQRADKYMNEFTTNNNEKCQNYINTILEQKQIETTKVMSLKEQEIQGLRTKINQHQIKLQKLNQDLVQAENTVIKNRETFEIQRTNLLRENQKITNQLQQTVNKNSVQFIQLRKEKQDLEEKCNLLNDECNNLQGDVASLEDSTAKLQRQVQSLKLKNQQLQESSKKQHLGITTQNNKLMQELQTKQSELNSFKQQVERRNTEIQSLKDQLTRQKTNLMNASKTNSTLNQVQAQLNKSLQKIKDLEASKIALDNEWKQKLQTEKDNTLHWMTQTTRKQSQLHSLNQIFGEISKTLAIKMRVKRQFTPDTLVQAIDSYSPSIGKVLITSTIMLGLDTIRPQIIDACQKFAKKTFSKSTVLFRYPDSKNMVSVLASKEFVSNPFIILYKTMAGWVVGSYSEAMKKPTFFFSFGSEDYENRFETEEEAKKLKIHMPETSPEISAIEFVNARFLQYGNGEFKVSAIDLSSGTANSDVVSNRYYGFDWKNVFRDKNESKIMLSEVEVHRIDFA